MKNIWLFPEGIRNDNGYSIVVKDDWERTTRRDEDISVFYSSQPIDIPHKHILIKREKIFSKHRILNFLKYNHTCEVSFKHLQFLKKFDTDEVDQVFCGDIIFYRVLRQIFPEKKLIVRFHNCFSRILERKRLLNKKLSLSYTFNLHTAARLERQIFKDDNVSLLFLCQEDLQYYNSLITKNNASVWDVPVEPKKVDNPSSRVTKLVWFGGIESHKEDSINWFINEVFFSLKKDFPLLEFHLFGKNTQKFNKREKGIFGNGYYFGRDFPFTSCAIYVNPDIIGGGVKIKLKSFIENNIKFISTPFGFEGYSKELIDQKNIVVKPEREWHSFLYSQLDT